MKNPLNQRKKLLNLLKKQAAEEESPAPAADDEGTDYDSMTVAELKELLKAAGKPVSGKKADLIARLNE